MKKLAIIGGTAIAAAALALPAVGVACDNPPPTKYPNKPPTDNPKPPPITPPVEVPPVVTPPAVPPPVVTPPVVTPPPPVVVTPPPVKKRVPPPPKKHKAVTCKHPATLRIIQQQRGTFYTETYPLAVTIHNTSGAATPKGSLILTDSGLQNFVLANGGRTERLVIPVKALRKGQTIRIERRMGFTGPEAFRAWFTTRAQYMVNGSRCGFTSDRAFEG